MTIKAQVDGLDQESLIRACMQLARRLREAEVPGTVASIVEDAAVWLQRQKEAAGADDRPFRQGQRVRALCWPHRTGYVDWREEPLRRQVQSGLTVPVRLDMDARTLCYRPEELVADDA